MRVIYELLLLMLLGYCLALGLDWVVKLGLKEETELVLFSALTLGISKDLFF